MYKEFFHLRTYPFENTPDPLFYYSSPSHREALANMLYGVREGKGFILISGDVGTGKTTLVQAMKRELGEADVVVEIATPWISSEEVMRVLSTRLAVCSVNEGEYALTEALKTKMLQASEEGHRVVLVVDEAHLLPERTLEGIRLLSNIEANDRKLIQIILLGQEELVANLGQYSLRQLNQRIALRFHLGRLAVHEVEDYIRFRLEVAGGSQSLFTSESVALIAVESGGVPRLINFICDNALLAAYSQSLNRVDEKVVQQAIERMRPLEMQVPAQLAQETQQSEHIAQIQNPVPPVPLPFDTPPPLVRPKEMQAEPTEFPYLPRDASRPPVVNLTKLLAGMLLLIVLGLAALAWWSLRTTPTTSTLTSESTQPAVVASAVVPDAGTQTAATATQMGDGHNAPGANQAQGTLIPMPVTVGQEKNRVIVTKQEVDLKEAAAQFYGAWNETVEDVVLAANPDFVQVDKLPSGALLKLPMLTREQLIVQAKANEYYIYYASFKNPTEASVAAEALKLVWQNVVLSTVTNGQTKTYRLFVGHFSTKELAQSVVYSIWFKYLPKLG